MSKLGDVLMFIGLVGWCISSYAGHVVINEKKEILARKHVAWTLECAKSCNDAGLRIEAVSFGSNPSCSCR